MPVVRSAPCRERNLKREGLYREGIYAPDLKGQSVQISVDSFRIGLAAVRVRA